MCRVQVRLGRPERYPRRRFARKRIEQGIIHAFFPREIERQARNFRIARRNLAIGAELDGERCHCVMSGIVARRNILQRVASEPVVSLCKSRPCDTRGNSRASLIADRCAEVERGLRLSGRNQPIEPYGKQRYAATRPFRRLRACEEKTPGEIVHDG